MTASADDDVLAALARRLFEAPGDGAAHFEAGRAHLAGQRWERAAAHLRVAVAAEPQSAQRWSQLGVALQAARRGAEARFAVERALALDAALAEAWTTRGLLEAEAGDTRAARAHFEQALRLQPDFAPARLGLATLDETLGRIDDAIAGYRAALEIDPRLVQAHYSLGVLHQRRTGHLEQATAHYRSAIACEAGHASAHHNLSHALLTLGRFEEGWLEHAWRPPRRRHEAAMARAGRRYAVPEAAALDCARVALIAEQGLGDTLFFLRFAPALRERGAVLEFVGDGRLAGMLARTALFEAIAAKTGELAPGPRHELLVGDLALLVPAAGTPPLALQADPARLQGARERLASLGPGPYVGIAWRAGDPQTGIHQTLLKEAPLEALGAALRGVEATFACVQRDPRAGEITRLADAIGRPVHDLSDTNRDLEAALAVMAALDDYVGVSSTNVHLRAGTGRGARVLVPFPPEWRWMAHGPSPWFPSMQVHRQSPDGAWGAALEALARELRPN